MTRRTAFLLAHAVLTVCAVAQSAPAPRDLSADLRTFVVQRGIPGMCAAVVREDGVTALGAAGVRRKGSPAMLTVTDKMHIGSCGKAMTATVIAMLVEEGKLRWDTTLGESFPELRAEMKPDWPGVSLTQLLTHSAGAPNSLDPGGLWYRLWQHGGTPIEQRRDLVVGVLTRDPEAKPGTRYIYSNAGYAIAGHIAERIEQTTWEELVQRRLFDPLGMSSAGFGPPGSKDSLDQPRGHKEDGEVVEPDRHADNPPAIAPAGTVHCSIQDWAKFVQLHLDAELGKPRLLSAESFRMLHQSHNGFKPAYAMGWGIVNRDWAGGRVLTHNGSNTMWFCAVWVAPLKQFAVLVACNQGGKKAEKTVDDAVAAIIKQELARRAD